MPKSQPVTLKSLDQRVGKLDDRVQKLGQSVEELDESVKNLDRRVVNIELSLPTLATKEDLRDFPTRADPKGFATKEDVVEEGERSRRYMKVLVEDLRDTVNRALDGNIGHTQRLDEHSVRLDGHDAAIGAIDVRLTGIERPPRRGR